MTRTTAAPPVAPRSSSAARFGDEAEKIAARLPHEARAPQRGPAARRPGAYGLRNVDGGLAHGPETYAVARRIADEVLAGSTLLAVVAGLNADGIPSPRGGSWRVPSVAALLRSGG